MTRCGMCGYDHPRRWHPMMKPDKCKKHPRYKAVLKPRVDCEACWALWRYEHE